MSSRVQTFVPEAEETHKYAARNQPGPVFYLKVGPKPEQTREMPQMNYPDPTFIQNLGWEDTDPTAPVPIGTYPGIQNGLAQ